MSRILLRLALLVPLLLLLTFLLEAYGRVLPPTPDALLDVCPLPCVLGITPNITLDSEIENIFSFTLPDVNQTLTRRDTLGTIEYLFETSVGGQYIFGSVSMYTGGESVQAISINALFPLSILFEKWGAPDCVQLSFSEGIPVSGIVDWRRENYFAQVLFAFQSDVEWSTAIVQSVTVRGDLQEGCGAGMQAWQGFAPAWRYQ